PGVREELVEWFSLAESNDEEKEHWLWSHVVDELRKVSPVDFDSQSPVPASKIEELVSASEQLFEDAKDSNGLTDMEVRYLLHRIWDSHFSGAAYRDVSVPEFEEDLSTLRKRYITSARIL
ncbi:MAG: hypothetical protein ACRD2L_18945, partial [Terriglobia bacterium]